MEPIQPTRSLFSLLEAFLLVGGAIAAVGWVFWRTLKRSDEPLRLVWKWGLTVFLAVAAFKLAGPLVLKEDPFWRILGMLFFLPFAGVIGVIWAPNVADMLASPLTSLFDGGAEPVERMPVYSATEVRLHQGRYAEAAAAVRQELLKFPGDIHGRLLLADILANKLHQPIPAEETLRQILSLPHAPAPAVASALNQLADLHLQHGRDPAAAKAALEEIIARLPDTAQAANAAERIGHLPTVETLEDRAAGAPVVLKAGQRDLGLKKAQLPTAEETLDRRITALLDQVQKFPADVESRMELVRLLAEGANDVESARAQIAYGLAVPHQNPRQTARWLHLLATVEIQQAQNLEGARRALQRVVDQFPDSVVAESARQRMEQLAVELKGTRAGAEIQLGTYEKDLGLKRRTEG